MMKYLFWGLVLFAFSCNRTVQIQDIKTPPTVIDADEAFENVYQPLDGRWEGDFLIYEDTARGKKEEGLLSNISHDRMMQQSLKLSGKIDVEQEYISESPYFQRVTIKDFYPDENKVVTSYGVNKVQNGQMWCVVQKPDEMIIHEGRTEGEETIIWERQEINPQKVEYFRETVLSDTYEIIGWGYYEGDDLQLMPRFWFYGNYQRQK